VVGKVCTAGFHELRTSFVRTAKQAIAAVIIQTASDPNKREMDSFNCIHCVDPLLPCLINSWFDPSQNPEAFIT
jgi:hypothetical protein